MRTRTWFATSLMAVILGTSTPEITSVTPAAPSPSPKSQTLTVNGRDFQPGLTLTVADPVGQRTVVQGNEILSRRDTSFQFAIALAMSGSYSLVVTNTDGGTSQPFALVVKASAPADGPVIEKITPSEPPKRPDTQLVQVEGQRFAPGLRAIVNDPMGADVTDIAVSKVTPSSFELSVRLEHNGEYSLVVTNPSGAVSNLMRFIVR